MMAAQFQKVGQTATAYLNDIITMDNVAAVPYDDHLDGVAAQITVRVGEAYVNYYFISDAYIPGTETEIGKDSWATEGGDAAISADDLIALGDSFWFSAPENSLIDKSKAPALTINGEVYGESTLERSIVGNKTWQMVGNPFPTTLKNNSIDMNGYTAVPYDDHLDGIANQITVRDGEAYINYFYISDAYIPGTETEIGYDCWATEGGDALDFIANPQEGMWMSFPQAAGTIIFKK